MLYNGVTDFQVQNINKLNYLTVNLNKNKKIILAFRGQYNQVYNVTFTG